MPFGASLSLCLHVAVVILSVIGLPSIFGRQPAPAEVVSVELVTMPEEPLQESRDTGPVPPPKAEPVKPLAEIPPPPPVEQAEPAPVLDIPEPEPLPSLEPVPPPETVPKLQKKPSPPPRMRLAAAPTPRRTPPPKLQRKPEPPPDEFQSLLTNLAESREKERDNRPPKAPSPVETAARTARIVEAVRRQLIPCWSIPAGAKDVADMRVAIHIRLNPDGALGGLPLVEDAARLERDPFFRAVAESALRALRDPQCMPLQLPYKQYQLWKKITFNFDPGEALGQ